jgi:hypothetical protein
MTKLAEDPAGLTQIRPGIRLPRAVDGDASLPTLSLTRWGPRLATLADEYRRNTPFPHVFLADFLEPGVAETLEGQFPAPSTDQWTLYGHHNVRRKYGNADYQSFPQRLRDLIDSLRSPEFLAWLSALTGIDDLLADPALEGAGLHQSEGGGFLHIHADFTMHSHQPDWRRRLNLILYLNSDWQEEWNGQLELWNRDMTRAERVYPPAINHCVIFTTSDDSFHGHPEPLRCPPGRTRKSVILYYYTRDLHPGHAPRPTSYQTRPGDSVAKRVLSRLEGFNLAIYYRLKRRFGFDDRVASRFLGLLRGRRKQASSRADPSRFSGDE